MSFTSGKSAVLKIAGTDISAYVTRANMNRLRALLDVTVFGATGHAFVPGLTDLKITANGPLDATATNIDATLNVNHTATTTVTWEFDPAGTAVGTPKYSGNCWIPDYTEEADVNGLATWTCNIQIDGAVTRAVN